MAVETKLSLEHDTIEKLQDLIQANIDSYHSLLQAADRADDRQAGSLFRELAAQRSAQAAELKGLVNGNGERPPEDGSFAASLKRAWTTVKAALPGDRNERLLDAAEAAEDRMLDRYEQVLREIAGSAVTDVLNRHYGNVKSAHDRVKMLRDMQRA